MIYLPSWTVKLTKNAIIENKLDKMKESELALLNVQSSYLREYKLTIWPFKRILTVVCEGWFQTSKSKIPWSFFSFQLAMLSYISKKKTSNEYRAFHSIFSPQVFRFYGKYFLFNRYIKKENVVHFPEHVKKKKFLPKPIFIQLSNVQIYKYWFTLENGGISILLTLIRWIN